MPKQYYDDEFLLTWLKNLAKQLGRTPNSTDIDNARGPCAPTFSLRFGGLYRALTLAGLAAVPRKDYSERNRDIVRIRHEGKTLAEIGKKHGISRERARQILDHRGVVGKPHTEGQSKTLCAYAPYKTVKEIALDAEVPGHVAYTLVRTRGLKTKPATRHKYSDEDLLEHLRVLAKQLRKTPTTFDLRLAAGPNQEMYHRRFGSLRKAQKRAGLIPNGPGRPPCTSENDANTLT